MLLKIITLFLSIIPALVIVGFLTLLERKVLSLSQIRLGPNKVGWGGIPQPLSDAIKLFSKMSFFPGVVGGLFFILSPIFILFISMSLWTFLPHGFSSIFCSNSWIMFMIIMSLAVYPLLIMGWSSSCIFSNLGSLRAVAQLVSYETVMGTFIFFWILSTFSTSMSSKFSLVGGWMILIPMAYFVWLVTCLAETNRTPFDFSEGESELVSGFNTEYASQLFALIFMAEYLSISIMSIIFSLLLGNKLEMWVTSAMIMVVWIWVRATYVRHRYDKLMAMCWKAMLPSVMFITFIFMITLFLI